jgi:hypothetical protein
MKPLLVFVVLALAACGGAAAKNAAPAPTTAAPSIEAPTTTVAAATTVAPTTTSTVAPTTTTTVAPTTTVPPTTTTAAPKLGAQANPIDGNALNPDFCKNPNGGRTNSTTPCGYWEKLQIDATPGSIDWGKTVRLADSDNPKPGPSQHWVGIGFLGLGKASLADELSAYGEFKLVGDKGTFYDSEYVSGDPNNGLVVDLQHYGDMTSGVLLFLVDDDDANLLMARMDYKASTDEWYPVQFIRPHVNEPES